MTQFVGRIYAVALMLPLPLFAQDPETAAKTAAVEPVLVLKTSRPDIVWSFAERLGSTEAPGAIADDQHYVFTLPADGKCTLATAAGRVELFRLAADPGALMDLFHDQIETQKAMFRGAMTMGLQQAGMPPKDAAAYVRDVLDFPYLLRRIVVEVVGDPATIATKGLDVTVDLDARPDRELAPIFAQLKPGSQGAPSPIGTDAVLQVRSVIAPEGLAALYAPFRDLAMGMTAGDDEQRRRVGAMYDSWVGLYDGGFSMTLSKEFHTTALMGVLDPGAVAKLIASDEYLETMRAQKLPNRDATLTVSPAAFEHRGVTFLKSVVSDLPPTPMMPDGEMVSRFGVAGNLAVMTTGGGDADAAAVVDAVLDQKVKRAPLSGATLVDAIVDLRAMAKMMLAGTDMNGEPGEDMPTHVTVQIGVEGTSLQVKAHVQ